MSSVPAGNVSNVIIIQEFDEHNVSLDRVVLIPEYRKKDCELTN